MPSLKWNRLKENKCPKCRSFLETGKSIYDETIVQCHNKKCDFYIRPERMQQIVNNQHNSRASTPRLRSYFYA